MAKNPQFNMRVPSAILAEFRDAVGLLRDSGVTVDEQEAGRAAILHFSRLGKHTLLDCIERFRNYEIEAIKGDAVFDAWTRAMYAEAMLRLVEEHDEREGVYHLADTVRMECVKRYEFLRDRYPWQYDPLKDEAFLTSIDGEDVPGPVPLRVAAEHGEAASVDGEESPYTKLARVTEKKVGHAELPRADTKKKPSKSTRRPKVSEQTAGEAWDAFCGKSPKPVKKKKAAKRKKS